MDEDINLNSFKINTNNDIITYSNKGLEKISKNDRIIFHTNDPLGNNVVLWESTFIYHILGEHGNESRYYLNTESNIQRIKYGIMRPVFILEDKHNENRLEFLSVADIEAEGEIRIKGLTVITEQSDSIQNSFEVVTVYPRSKISQDITNRRVIYNVNNNNDRT